ncbi:MAG TPA: transglycosylase domain-containing protein [Azospirillaceae bacterium]|nr:transglycosylase domain-containing protein [Azospirillaceae bacterium]
MGGARWIKGMAWGVSLTIAAGVGGAAWYETKTSWLQSHLLARLGKDLTYRVAAGPTDKVRYPEHGPYDERLGYVGLPKFIERLSAGPYRVEQQARWSQPMLDYHAFGGFTPYAEKTAAGLSIFDRAGNPLHNAKFPERTYANYSAVPPLVVRSLLFIENRELLDPTYPNRNPAVEWDRFALAVIGMPLEALFPERQQIGGSTLATQIEKYRHSPGGQTSGGTDKLRQMMSASVRAYLAGSDTTKARFQIVVDYLNSTPLSARPGIGEVNGLGDGLWAWFGTDFATANRILAKPARTEDELARQAIVYKQVLSLLLAQRRPSFYLSVNRTALETLANQHLSTLEKAGVIDAALADAARNFKLRFRPDPPQLPEVSFVEQKAVNAIRNRLLGMLGTRSLYELDRLDLSVETTLDQAAQDRVTQVLKRLRDPSATTELGLVGERLLGAADPAKVVYSVTVYERTPTANLVRVQVDTLDQPLDLNEGAKLDLGSTAKLRTLVSYLEIVAKLYGRLHMMKPHELEAVAVDAQDRMTQWVARTLASHQEQGLGDPGLEGVLTLAMQREYSASPGERFFTGGGLHTFGNFDNKDNGRVMNVGEAFRHSVNLVFIRMMRDIVNHYIAEGPARKDDVMDDPRHPVRQMYLARFADQEGSVYLNKFWGEYQGLSPDAALAKLGTKLKGIPDRLAVAYRTVRPQATQAEMAAFIRKHVAPEAAFNAASLYEKYDPAKWSLNDRGYIARTHPLELWLVAYLQDSPKPVRRDMLKESSSSRQESYQWLFTTRHKRAQDTRIGIMLEEEAFSRIHAEWKRLGYPFESLIASYATSIGSSADRPGALADLMGVIVNDGVRLPTARVKKLHFAAGTPYEAVVSYDDRMQGERVMTPEVARIVRLHLNDIVQNGTARRVNGAFTTPDGNPIMIGGKTGTGDHRFERYGPGGSVLESRVVNRTATFVFYIGDRFFGVITAHVHGPDAANYHFTSALPSQLLKAMAPALQPLIQQQPQTAEAGAL